jgi:D-glycero-D-manno-heptose 1,7-bisphosphate phosphatase
MKLVILDRDGVINFDSPSYIKSPDEWHPIPGSLEAIARLNKAGYVLGVATNQSGIGRGKYSIATLTAIHTKMCQELQKVGGYIHKIVFCPHTPEDNCSCRKPKTGLLLQLAQHFSCSLEGVPFIGDKQTDIEAALKVGAQPILINGKKNDDNNFDDLDIPRYPNLQMAVNDIIQFIYPPPNKVVDI